MSIEYDIWICCDDCGNQIKGQDDGDGPYPDPNVPDDELPDYWAIWSIPREKRDSDVWGGINHVCPDCCQKRGWVVEDNYVVKSREGSHD